MVGLYGWCNATAGNLSEAWIIGDRALSVRSAPIRRGYSAPKDPPGSQCQTITGIGAPVLRS